MTHWDNWGKSIDEKEANEIMAASTVPCLKNGQAFELIFDGTRLTSSLGDFNVLAVSGVPIDSKSLRKNYEQLNATTIKTTTIARYSFDYSEDRQKLKETGPIPSGDYRIYVSLVNSGMLFDGSFRPRHLLAASSWGSYSWSLFPQGNTNAYERSGFFIHGGSVPGSKGCIDILDNDSNLAKYLSDLCNCYVPIRVSYIAAGASITYESWRMDYAPIQPPLYLQNPFALPSTQN